MSRVELADGLDGVIAERVLRPAVDRALDMLLDQSRTRAPATRTWVTMRDERVRQTHVDTDGQTIPANLRFKVPKPGSPGEHELARHPRDPSLSAANAINCFPGSVTPGEIGAIRAIWRAPYVGPMIVVRTATGRVLTGTPNHPVLTPAGLIPMGALDEGGYLIQSLASDAPSRRLPSLAAALGPSTTPQIDDVPATLADVYVALAEAFGSQRMVGASVNLYGDPLAGDVEVVAVDGMLTDHLAESGAQVVDHLRLAHTDEPTPRLCLADSLDVADRVAATGRIGLRDLAPPSIGAERLHAHPIRGTTAANLYAAAQQAGAHSSSIHPEGSPEGFQRFPTLVAADQIVAIEVDHGFSGHVYSLTTESGLFEADGFIVSNCRCDDPTSPHLLRESIKRTSATVIGTRVEGSVETRFARAAESEFGTSEDEPAHFMTNALQEVARRLQSGNAR